MGQPVLASIMEPINIHGLNIGPRLDPRSFNASAAEVHRSMRQAFDMPKNIIPLYAMERKINKVSYHNRTPKIALFKYISLSKGTSVRLVFLSYISCTVVIYDFVQILSHYLISYRSRPSLLECLIDYSSLSLQRSVAIVPNFSMFDDSSRRRSIFLSVIEFCMCCHSYFC